MENLGVQYLSAVVKQAGHECRIVNLDNALSITMDWKPEVAGLSIMTGSQDEFKRLGRTLKKITETTILVGGAHPSFFPEDFEDEDCTVIRGEAEDVIAGLLQSPHIYPNIDDIPWPDRTDFPNMKVRDFISTRGCRHSCNYCFNQKWTELHPQFTRVRTRNPEDVCREIESVNPKFAYFQDSCFGLSRTWMKEFTNNYCKIPYQCHMRPAQIKEEIVHYLKTSNCFSLRMALEAASDRLRKLMNRPVLDTKNVLEASKLLRKAKIKFMIQNIIAIPTGTIEDDLSTLEVNISCKPDYAWCSIYSPYPGTVLGDMCKDKGWYSGDYSDIHDSFFDMSVLNFDPEYKKQTYCLQKVFALCTETGYMPKVNELNMKDLPMLVHRATRKLGDNRLYNGII